MLGSEEDRRSKREWRRRLVLARKLVPAEVHAEQAQALARAVLTVPGDTVCGYAPIGTEPGSLDLLDILAEDGRRVLLPVVSGVGPLDWMDYTGSAKLRTRSHGLLEPIGELLGPDAIGLAHTVLVPALAVDGRGVRLGRGGGHYDRSLPLAMPCAELIAVIRDNELVDRLPVEPHDVRMTAVITPGGGLCRL